MLLDHLSLTVLCAASVFGTSRGLPAVLLPAPESIKHASLDRYNELSQSSGSATDRIWHRLARKQSVLIAQNHENARERRLDWRKLERRTTNLIPLDLSRKPEDSKRKLLRRAATIKRPANPYAHLNGVWFEDMNDYLQYFTDWSACGKERFMMLVSRIRLRARQCQLGSRTDI